VNNFISENEYPPRDQNTQQEKKPSQQPQPQNQSFIQNLIENKINQSNLYNIEEIAELEDNIQNIVNNNFVTIVEMKKVERNITEVTHKIQQDLKENIDDNKKIFEDFINS
jgi:hypothetical protein